MDYSIRSMKIVGSKLDNSRFRFVHYKGFLCEFWILQIKLSTRLYFNGYFYPKLSFICVEDAVNWIHIEGKPLIKNITSFFRKAYIKSYLYAIGSYI
jgi:hypothetical protein